MDNALSPLVWGERRSKEGHLVLFGVAIASFGLVFGNHWLDVVDTCGGFCIVPWFFPLVAAVGAFWAGYSNRGLLGAWLLAFSALLGYQAWRVAQNLATNEAGAITVQVVWDSITPAGGLGPVTTLATVVFGYGFLPLLIGAIPYLLGVVVRRATDRLSTSGRSHA